jgi:hypothetical protein
MKRALLFDSTTRSWSRSRRASRHFWQPLKSRSPVTACRPTSWRWRHANERVSCGTRHPPIPIACAWGSAPGRDFGVALRGSSRMSVGCVSGLRDTDERHGASPRRSRMLGSDREHAVMVGDSLTRDVDGAVAAGLGGVLLNRHRRLRPDDRPDLVQELFVAVAGKTLPDHAAGQDVQRGEQRGRAVALVVMGHRAPTFGLHR